MPIFKNDIFFLIYIIYPNYQERGTPMTKKVAWRFLLVILSLMILIGVGLVIIMYYFGHEGTLIKLDIQYEEPAYGTLCLYDYLSEKRNASLTRDDRRALEDALR